jgi:hypothetical protein
MLRGTLHVSTSWQCTEQLRRSGYTQIHIKGDCLFPERACEFQTRFEAVDESGVSISGYVYPLGNGRIQVDLDPIPCDVASQESFCDSHVAGLGCE